jgi:O-antigen ligase
MCGCMANIDQSPRILTPRTIIWPLVLLIVLLPFDEGGNGHIVQALTQSLLLGSAVAWGVACIRARQWRLRCTRLDALVLAGLAWISVSLVFSEYRYATIFEGIKILSYAALWFLSRPALAEHRTRTLALTAIVGSSSLQFAVALYNRISGQTPSAWQAGFVNPNELACLALLGLSVALGFALFSPGLLQPSGGQSAWHRRTFAAFMLAAGGVSGVLLVMLPSRGAWLSMTVTIFVLATLRHRLAGLMCVLLLITAVLLPLPHGSVAQRLVKTDDPFAYQRLDIWRNSLRMFRDHPLTGVGLGMFPYYGAAYNFPVEHQVARYGKRLDLAHNDLLHIAAELGIVGVLLAVGGLLYLGRLSARHLRRRPIDWQVAAASAGLLGMAVNGLVSNLLLTPALAMMSVILAAVLVESTDRFARMTWSIPARRGIVASWHGALALGAIYVAIPVIGYPFLAHNHFLRYQQARRKGSLGEAVEHLRAAIRYVPAQAYYHHAFGQLYAAAFRNQPNLDAYYEAHAALTEAIRHNRREAQFHMALGNLHRAMFHEMMHSRPTADNALREYAHALSLNPFNPFMRAEMATLYADLDEFDLAVSAIRQAIADEPNFVRGHQLLGAFLRHIGRTAEARQAFATAEQIRRAYPVTANMPDYTQMLLRSLD